MFDIVIKNIKKSFKAYGSIYSLLIVSQFLAVLILFFVYGIVTGYEMKKNEIVTNASYVTAIFIEPVSVLSVKEVYSEILPQMEERMDYAFLNVLNNESDIEITCIMEYSNKKFCMPIDEFGSDRLIDGRYPNEIEMNDGSKIGFGYLNSQGSSTNYQFKVGESVDLYGEKYEIIGVIEAVTKSRVTIPICSCTEDMKTAHAMVAFEGFILKDDYDLFKEIMLEHYGSNVVINDFEPVDITDIIAYDSMIILAVVIGLIAMLDTILVYNYVMKKRKKQMAIIGLEGATRIQQVLICETEIFLITILVTACGVVIFRFLLENIIMDVYDIRMPIFNMKIYAGLLLIYIGCIICGSLGLIICNTRKSLLEIRRG